MVFPPYETLYDGRVVNHAHNDYLEALSDTGSGWRIVLRVVSGDAAVSFRAVARGERKASAAVLNLSGWWPAPDS